MLNGFFYLFHQTHMLLVKSHMLLVVPVFTVYKAIWLLVYSECCSSFEVTVKPFNVHSSNTKFFHNITYLPYEIINLVSLHCEIVTSCNTSLACAYLYSC